MFEDAGHTPEAASLHGAAPADAQAIINLREVLAGMVPAASLAALQASTTHSADAAGGVGDRHAEGRFRPSEHELAVLRREAEAINRIRALEDLKAACAAAQARETAALHQHRLLDEAARGIPASRRGLGLGSEIGLARRQTQQRGSTHLRQARHLTDDLPHTFTALRTGQIGEEHAATVERHTHWLPAPGRRNVDADLADRLPDLGIRELTHEVQALAHREYPEAAAEQYDQAVTTRHVRIKAAEHGMAYLTALLPALEAAACFNAITDQAATTLAFGEAGGRSPKQVLADLFVERLTGRNTEETSPVEIQLIMTDAALLGAGSEPAWIAGHGPLPAAVARKLVTAGTAGTDPGPSNHSPEARVFLRRLYTSPETGQLVAMDSQRREFSGKLRHMIMMRDDICRTPYCGAPIRHVDHATPYRQGGPTSYANGSGLCERCNYTKEYTGWKHRTTPDDLEVTTPTGHRYSSRSRPLAAPPGTPIAAPPAVVSSLAPATPDDQDPEHRHAPSQPAVPCTADTEVTVRLPSGSTDVATYSPAVQQRRMDLAWSRARPRSHGMQVEYSRAA